MLWVYWAVLGIAIALLFIWAGIAYHLIDYFKGGKQLDDESDVGSSRARSRSVERPRPAHPGRPSEQSPRQQALGTQPPAAPAAPQVAGPQKGPPLGTPPPRTDRSLHAAAHGSAAKLTAVPGDVDADALIFTPQVGGLAEGDAPPPDLALASAPASQHPAPTAAVRTAPQPQDQHVPVPTPVAHLQPFSPPPVAPPITEPSPVTAPPEMLEVHVDAGPAAHAAVPHGGEATPHLYGTAVAEAEGVDVPETRGRGSVVARDMLSPSQISWSALSPGSPTARPNSLRADDVVEVYRLKQRKELNGLRGVVLEDCPDIRAAKERREGVAVRVFFPATDTHRTVKFNPANLVVMPATPSPQAQSMLQGGGVQGAVV